MQAWPNANATTSRNTVREHRALSRSATCSRPSRLRTRSCFCFSPMASYMTGSVLLVDGGAQASRRRGKTACQRVPVQSIGYRLTCMSGAAAGTYIGMYAAPFTSGAAPAVGAVGGCIGAVGLSQFVGSQS